MSYQFTSSTQGVQVLPRGVKIVRETMRVTRNLIRLLQGMLLGSGLVLSVVAYPEYLNRLELQQQLEQQNKLFSKIIVGCLNGMTISIQGKMAVKCIHIREKHHRDSGG